MLLFIILNIYDYYMKIVLILRLIETFWFFKENGVDFYVDDNLIY